MAIPILFNGATITIPGSGYVNPYSKLQGEFLQSLGAWDDVGKSRFKYADLLGILEKLDIL